MANTFKNASLVSVNHAALATLYTCPAATTGIILGLALTNKTDNSVNASVQLTDTSAEFCNPMVLQMIFVHAVLDHKL